MSGHARRSPGRDVVGSDGEAPRVARARFEAAVGQFSEGDRRELLRLMGASLALAGLSGCSHDPDVDARPYVTTPDGETTGVARAYASAVTFCGWAQPILGTTHEGRPTKLEGLPEHPACRGATDAFTQAALLGLYDPGRSKGPARQGRPTDWAAFDTAMVRNLARLDGVQGEGFRLLTGAVTSPTLGRLIDAMLARWPRAAWHVWEPAGDDLRLAAARIAFGRPLAVRPILESAEVVVSLGDDLLGPGPRQVSQARGWSTRRAAWQHGVGQCRLLVAEAAPTLTGTMAEDRLIAGAERIDAMVMALAAATGVQGVAAPPLAERERAWVANAARALSGAKGAACVAVDGFADPAIQAMGLAINGHLGAFGRTVVLTEPLLKPDARPLTALVSDARAGRVDTLAVFDANPVHSAPSDLGVAAAFSAVRLRIHAGLRQDETAALSHWHAPLEHDLETWGDALAVDGRPSLIQPLVRPFHAVRARSVLLAQLTGAPAGDSRGLLSETWRRSLGGLDSPAWRGALERGFIDTPAATVSATPAAVSGPAVPVASGGLTLLIKPDPSVWDGVFAHNPWLQEQPRPFSTLTWDNVVAVAPEQARRLNVGTGDVVRLAAAGGAVEGPVFVAAGQDPATVVVTLGYGRREPGIGRGVGFDVGAVRSATTPWRVPGAVVTAVGRKAELARTQPFTDLGDHDFVRVAARGQTRRAPPPAVEPSFYPPKRLERPQWAMTVDLDLCIGCSACVAACQAENNVPVVGKKQVAHGRHMHWLRIDRYASGPAEAPAFFNQPVPCMHCEQAPCEMGCPVNAAVHSRDGMNLQVYNRCIGTRTCSSYCPYKVRRFNWLDFTGDDPPELRAARNPEVTVRARGVMEKCTYCVQRVQAGKFAAQIAGRPVADGEVRTACQQVCPTDAIIFGDAWDPQSAVTERRAQARNYTLLEEVNTRPRTTYLARLQPDGGGG